MTEAKKQTAVGTPVAAAEAAELPYSEQKMNSVNFGNKVFQHTLQGTKKALNKSKNAVHDTVKTVTSSANAAVASSSESLQTMRERMQTIQAERYEHSSRSVKIEEPIEEIKMVTEEGASLKENEALTEQGVHEDLGTVPAFQSAKSTSFLFPGHDVLSALFGSQRGLALLHLSLVLVTYPTYKYWTTVINLPVSLVLVWLLVAFSLGNLLSLHILQGHETKAIQSVSAPISVENYLSRQEVALDIDCGSTERNTSTWASVWSRRSLGHFPSRRDWHASPALIRPLSMSASIKRWNCDPTRDKKNRQLMHLLLNNRSLRRKKRLEIMDQEAGELEKETVSTHQGDSIEALKAPMAIGNFDLADADSFEGLDDYIVEPYFKLRGMDVFLCEADGGVPETKIADHSWFVKHGLREAPTFLVNLSTQWGNILLYFSFPDWMKDWDSLKENDEDSKEIKALKSFFSGSDQNRNASLYFMPSVVEAPYAVRCVAPSKHEYPMGDRSYLPLLWTKYPADPEKNKCIAMELEIDCMSSGWIRSMAGIVKRNLKSLSIDVAVLMKMDEAQLCLALWRFDHIDISSSPTMPAPAE